MNRRLKGHIETVFIMTDYRWLYISSTIIKEAVRLGGDIRGLVPDWSGTPVRTLRRCLSPTDPWQANRGARVGFSMVCCWARPARANEAAIRLAETFGGP
jgi:hypothetical protein